MVPFLSFVLLLLLVPFTLSASLPRSVLGPRQVAPWTSGSPTSLPVENVTFWNPFNTPWPVTDGAVCIRNAGCALAAHKAKCGYPADTRIPGCTHVYPTAEVCCGKDFPKDHPCTIFWPESHEKCQEQMKNHYCLPVHGRPDFCEPVNTNETPGQCALKSHCAAKNWEKDCGKWHQRVSHPKRCAGAKPTFEYCCLTKLVRPPYYSNPHLPPSCQKHWPKDVNHCAKGCKTSLGDWGGDVKCKKAKRDTNPPDGVQPAIIEPSNRNVSSSAAEAVTAPTTADSNSTVCKREDRPWVDGDPIPPVTDCKFGTRCALAAWKVACDKWYQKISPGCWHRAPAYHKCCNARGEKKPPQNDACKLRWPVNIMHCQDVLRAWDCKDDAKGNLVCERIPGIPTVVGK